MSVNISVEAPVENIIQEISYDGQEIYQLPLSMSENLAKLAQKIDFSKSDSDDLNADITEIDKTEDEVKDTSGLWPWDSIKTKLRNAMTEVCVLTDVLTIAKQKQYLILDPVPQELPEPKPMAQIYARKKALAGAGSVLLQAAERLRASQSEAARNRASVPDFHIELLRLRQNWRLKKTGVFEVTKAEDDQVDKVSPPPSPSTSGGPPIQKPLSALRVTVPTELQGVAYIMVLCQKDQEDLCSASINLLGSSPSTANPDMHWQQKLEAAQNVLFCKELFAQLAKEAVQLQAPIPHMVVGNQIMATVLPGIQLIIGLCHSTGSDKKNKDGSTSSLPPKSEHDHVLEHSLHQLLREVHHKNTHHPFPHPSSGPIGPSKRRCIAGPTGADRYELLELTKSETLLEQIIEQAQHFFMRLRAEYVLDTIAKEVKDPLIISHWNALNSPTQYDSVFRTSLVIHVSSKNLKCVCRDGRVMKLSYEPQELRDLIFCQIYQHQISAMEKLAKCMGWQFLSSSAHLGLGGVEPLGNASSCLLSSPMGDRMISVRCEPQAGIQVAIAHSPRKDFFCGQLVKERKWENLGGPFKEVRWDKMEGKNFLNKMELLMASLTSS
ncbi:hypothetical protein M8J76_007845 [Diaphorina citri]|nr:hypothetical protein M8J76_007845 [Diaphorina citri]